MTRRSNRTEKITIITIEMGRPLKKGLDYFPLDVGFFDDDKIAFVSARFQEKGELIAIKLLCKIYRDNGYFYQWGEDEAILFAKRVVGDPSQHALVNDVVYELVKRGFFNKSIFNSFKILTSKGIQERYRKICTDSKRIYEISEDICLIEVENGKKVVSSEKEGVSSEEKPVSSGGKYTKESKGKERKEKEISPSIPQGGSGGKSFLNLIDKTPPKDGVKRNWDGLKSFFEKFSITGHEADEIILLSNYGQTSVEPDPIPLFWILKKEVEDAEKKYIEYKGNRIHTPGAFILSRLRAQT